MASAQKPRPTNRFRLTVGGKEVAEAVARTILDDTFGPDGA